MRLRLSGRLDRESVSRYSVVVVAFDGGQPQRSASLVVNVVITDTNDNIPQFDRSTIIIVITVFMSPPVGKGAISVAFVRPSVCLFVRPSRT